MGPLFSIIAALLLAIVGTGIVIACAYGVLRLRYANSQAFVFALAFAIGAPPSGLLALLTLGLIERNAPALNPEITVGLSIAWLACTTLAGGIATTRYMIRRLATLG
jgi:hypothetical protein